MPLGISSHVIREIDSRSDWNVYISFHWTLKSLDETMHPCSSMPSVFAMLALINIITSIIGISPGHFSNQMVTCDCSGRLGSESGHGADSTLLACNSEPPLPLPQRPRNRIDTMPILKFGSLLFMLSQLRLS
ncbi:hypothetical protein CC78DRAFT_616309 [Lojkania enalia]|uniref:Uncharacterized protein n=1 Tax=Lojkania enalia TaxID=147567 RepID=A0A9P4N4L5_9PLEO|nr:hypothetical protein CC78DRAFT_616309 [Didymosphaeria enalia]